jgi:hypothetical protein
MAKIRDKFANLTQISGKFRLAARFAAFSDFGAEVNLCKSVSPGECPWL